MNYTSHSPGPVYPGLSRSSGLWSGLRSSFLLLLSLSAPFVQSQPPPPASASSVSPYVLPIVVAIPPLPSSSQEPTPAIWQVLVDPADLDESVLRFGSTTDAELARQIIKHSVAARRPGSFRAEACSTSGFDWSKVPHVATNSLDIAMRWANKDAWRGDVPMLRTATNLWDVATLANQLGLAEWGKWYELGVLKGAFSQKLMELGGAKDLTVVDLWDEVDIYNKEVGNRNFDETAKVLSQFDFSRWRMWKMSTLEAATLVPDNSASFIYIDASHEYGHVRADIEAWWPKLKVGGMMAGDDYYNGYVPIADYTFGVKDAVDEFFGGERNHRVYATRPCVGQCDPDRAIFQNWYVLKCAE